MREKKDRIFSFVIMAIALIFLINSVVLYSQEVLQEKSTKESWPSVELQSMEERFEEISVQFSTLETYAPEKLFPDFQELEKINQLVETLDFNKRKFELLIQKYNLLEDELFPYFLKMHQEKSEMNQKIYSSMQQYVGNQDKSILKVQKVINTVALQIERLEKRIERLQIAEKEKEIIEENAKKGELKKQSTDIASQLLQLEEDRKNYIAKLEEEEKRLVELKEKEKEQAEKIEEKKKEADELKKKASATRDMIERLVHRTFAEVREIRLNGLEIPRLNTIKTFIYLCDTQIATLKEQNQNALKEIQSLKSQREKEITNRIIKSVIVVVIALFMIIFLIQLSRMVSKKIINRMEKSEKIDAHRKQRYQTLSAVILSFIKILVWILGVLWVLGELNIDVAPFLVAAGGISLAIGFGAQSLVKDMVSGFFILMEEQFALGDSVDIGGATGTVEKISLRTIKIRSLDGTLHTIPNGSISQVSNKTYQWSRALVKVGVSYDDDTQKVLSVLKRICEEIAADPEWKECLLDEPIAQGILSFEDSCVMFRILAKTLPGDHWSVERELHVRIKKAFDEEGIEIPYNYMNVIDRTQKKE